MAVEEGTIKVVWVEKDSTRIYSKMFEDIKEAQTFGKTKGDYLIFKLLQQENYTYYEWKLLPYGRHKDYFNLVQTYTKHKTKFDLLLKSLGKFVKK